MTVLCLLLLTMLIVSFNDKPYSYAPILFATATLDFPNTSAGSVNDLTVAVSGASIGDVVGLGVHNDAIVSNGSFTVWISSPGVATIRFMNNALLAGMNPASALFKIVVLKK